MKSRVRFRRQAEIEVKSNLSLTLRERGKIVGRRVGHNIWLNLGREYLAQLIAYSSFSPLTTYTDSRIRYMGFGIGGTRQIAPSVANAAPLSTAYPGTNNQTDVNPNIARLERPVRITGGSSTPPYVPGDLWLGEVQAPATFPTATQVTFKRLITNVQISYSPYLSIPLSEVMLFTNAADPNVYNNTGVAFDTFDTISKTEAFELETAWTIRF